MESELYIEQHIDKIAYEFLSAFATALEAEKSKRKTEEHTMYDSITISCRGFTGTLEKLEKTIFDDTHVFYTLSIREPEKGVIHTWESVRPSEIKLVSGRVTMGG